MYAINQECCWQITQLPRCATVTRLIIKTFGRLLFVTDCVPNRTMWITQLIVKIVGRFARYTKHITFLPDCMSSKESSAYSITSSTLNQDLWFAIK